MYRPLLLICYILMPIMQNTYWAVKRTCWSHFEAESVIFWSYLWHFGGLEPPPYPRPAHVA